MPTEQTRLDGIQKLISEGRFARAFEETDALLQTDPDDPDLLYLAAVSQRYSGRFRDALAILDRLKSQSPDNGRAHQEEGHNYRDMGQAREALRAYGRATFYNPALTASLKEQIRILEDLGDSARCQALRVQLDELQQLPQPLLVAMDLAAQNQLLKAESVCREFLQQAPDHVRGMRLLAEIGVKLGVLEDAEYLLESAVEFEPDNIEARVDYIQVLRKRQKFSQALAHAQALLKTQPGNPRFMSIYAVECMQSGDFDAAIAVFDRILERLPNDPATLTSKGHACKTQGDVTGAIAAYRGALEAHPLHCEAYYALANLKTYHFGKPEIDAMRYLESNTNLSFMDRVYLMFALGKALEDEGGYDESFQFYARGNKLKKAQSRYKAEQISAEMQGQQRVCSKDFFRDRENLGCPAPDPIFIVGLPRAGSTLLEQILSSHSQVDGTLELPNVLSLSQRLRRRRRDGQSPDYPDILATLSADELREFGEEYIRETRIHRQGAPLFIDKMPNNFRHIGLIKLMLPNAKVIDARRNAMACCFSMFKQLFAEGQEFSYSLEDAGRYYRDYVELMEHWDRVLPGFVLRVHNEDVIEGFENQVRHMLDYCGLPFEGACLDYHKTRRNVRTPSAEQVRRPVSREGMHQWRNYGSHLAPLKKVLGALDVTDSPAARAERPETHPEKEAS